MSDIEDEWEVPDPCPCHRCLEAEGKAVEYLVHDFCYGLARNMDEDGNYHDDEGNFRSGQTHEVIQ